MAKKKRVKIGKWKTVFKGLSFEVMQANAVYSNGAKKIFEKAYRIPSVIIVPIDGKGNIYLIKEYRLGSGTYEWFLPAGRMDKEKNPKKAAIRELQEEIGMKPGKLTLLSKHGSGNSLDYVHYVFLAEDLVKAPIEIDEDEDITVHKMPIKKAVKMMIDGEINIAEICFAIIKANNYIKKHDRME